MIRTKLKDHCLLGLLTREYRDLILRASPGGKLGPLRSLTPRERYVQAVFESVTGLLYACDQSHFAVDLIGGYRRGSAPKGMTRHAYIVFAVENILVRFGMIADRSLRLVNVVYDLRIPNRECRKSTIAENGHVSQTPTAKWLRLIDKAIAPHRELRNDVVHGASYNDPSLWHLGAFGVLAAEGAVNLEKFADFVKAEADEFVRGKRREFKAALARVENPLSGLLDSLNEEVKRRLKC